MSEDAATRLMLDAAERAATAGDFASAYESLRGALRHQEKALGPLHPDLANTLNNLAVVAERTGREKEAAPLYRRAAAIAEAAFPSDHPMVVASRQNLEDFCRARGLSIDPPAAAPVPDIVATRSADTMVVHESDDRRQQSDAPAPEQPSQPAVTTTAVSEAVTSDVTATRPSAPKVPVPDAGPRPTSSQPLPLAPSDSRVSRPVFWIATAVGITLVAALLLLRPRSSRDESTPQPEPAAAQPADAEPRSGAAEPQPPAPAVRGTPVPSGEVRPTTIPPTGKDRRGNTTIAAAASAVTIVTAEVCRTFSTSGRTWRCEPVGNSVAPGRVVFYTRLKSTQNAAVLHRWYRGSTLRQAVRLTTRANANEGYRTYSRQTVDKGEWRVELRTANGDLLHEQRFVVR